jgi:hypothetical protein
MAGPKGRPTLGDIHPAVERALNAARAAAIDIGLEVDAAVWSAVEQNAAAPAELRAMATKKLQILSELAEERKLAVAQALTRIRDRLAHYADDTRSPQETSAQWQPGTKSAN